MVQQARTDLNIATVGQISCVTPVQKLGAKTVESSTSSTSSTPKNVNTQKTKECYPQGGYPPLKNTKESTDSDEDSDYTEQDRMDCYNNPTNEKVIKSMQHSLKELRKIEARSKQIGRPTASTEAEINSTLKRIEELKGKHPRQ